MTALIISNEETDDMKIITSLKDSGLLIKDVSETIKNEAKRPNGGFLGMLLGTLGATLLGNILAGKVVLRTGEGSNRSLSNFEIRKYYQNEPKFNGIYSKNSLAKTRNGACEKNLDKYKSIIRHWIDLY